MPSLPLRGRPARAAWFIPVAIAALGAAAAAAPPRPSPAPPASSPARPPAVAPDHAERMERGMQLFARDVRPLLVRDCLHCHGGQKTLGGLDIGSRELLLKGGERGAVIVPGKPGQSRILDLLLHRRQPHMPLGLPKLKEAQVRTIATWIELGAPYDRPLTARAAAAGGPMVVRDSDRTFWSFRPLASPVPPTVRQPAWVRNGIDRFVLARLEQAGLQPNGEADRRTLVRRVAFDLTGLPPSPEDVQRFLADRQPGAYERLVDRLLDSPHFGERWARHWLDVARFAESHGFEHDYDRPNAYHYRDFVVRALNQDLPYDTFVKWQIAGDEYAPEDPQALAATGFLAAGVHSTQITASQVEKERYDELDDIVRTIGTSMLGLTVGCARCHDHKYDPLPVRDYYRMVSVFTTTVRSDYEVDLDPAGYRRDRAAWEAARAPVAAELERYDRDVVPARFKEWLASGAQPLKTDWVVPAWKGHERGAAPHFRPLPDGSILAEGPAQAQETYRLTVATHLEDLRALRLEALAHPSLVKGGPGRAENGNFALSTLRVTAQPLAGGPPVPVTLTRPRATFEQAGLPVAAAIDTDPVSSWAVDPQFGRDHAAAFDFAAPIGFPGGTLIAVTLEFRNNTRHSIGRLRLSLAAGEGPASIAGPALPEGVLRAAREGVDRLTAEERSAALAWYGAREPGREALARRLAEHDGREPRPRRTRMLISSEGVPAVRLHTQGGDFLEKTHFLKRGDPNQKGEVADPGYLSLLVRGAAEDRWKSAPPGGWRTSYRRRGLAEWMTDVRHGAGHLLARVIVNRMWHHHFGRGIVGTPSDFGLQGERPSHPELLDWLAGELIRGGWRLKPIHRLIVNSAAYRQGGRLDPRAARADPDNRLLHRRAPRRLEAELIRDTLLSVSGLLDPTPFGPGTLDLKMRRRSLYFFVKRSKLVPWMVLFDAPDALQGLDRRPVTTVAPQALLLLNNPLVREYAEAFAGRAIREGGGEAAGRVARAYSIALAREPTAAEAAAALRFLREQAASHAAEGRAEPDRIALADFCQVLFGANELVYVD